MDDTREILQRGVGDFTPGVDAYGRVLERRDRKARNRRLGAYTVVALIVLAGAVWGAREFRSAPTVLDRPPPSTAEATEFMNAFLQARVDGEGAEDYLRGQEIPNLYATTTGAPYERYELERLAVGLPGMMRFGVRMFAEGGSAVVAQSFLLERDEADRLTIQYIRGTTENEQAVTEPYSILDGEVTYSAGPPWTDFLFGSPFPPALVVDGLSRKGRFHVIADALPIGAGCRMDPALADAEALASHVRSDPDLEATAPVAVSVGGIDALRMDVVPAPGARICNGNFKGVGVVADGVPPNPSEQDPLIVAEGQRMRLYLLDLPEGSSARTLAIAIIAPEERFPHVVDAAAPIVDSFEFRHI